MHKLILGFLLLIILFSCKKNVVYEEDFDRYNDRVWINEKLWPIPLEEWKIENGRVECIGAIDNMRLNLLTHLIEGDGEFTLSVDMGITDDYERYSNAGIRLAIQDHTDNDIRSLCYFGKGINIGIDTEGYLFLGADKIELPEEFNYSEFTLTIHGTSANDVNKLSVICEDNNDHIVQIENSDFQNLDGMISFVQNFTNNGHISTSSNFYFDNISLTGTNLVEKPENNFGPILFSMYTIDEKMLNLTAQMPPLGVDDNDEVILQFEKQGKWEDVQSVKIEKNARIAPFSVKEYDTKHDQNYRVVYSEEYVDGSEIKFYYEGIIPKEPESSEFSVGGLTCQEANGFPYRPLSENLAKSNPDMLYFSGDQLYEGNGGYGIIREPGDRAILNYLGKWYMFGWAFGDVMKDRPTVCIPDDHNHKNRSQQAELKASGYGMIYFDKENREVTCESIRFLVDVDDIANAQFPGWLVTIDLDDGTVK